MKYELRHKKLYEIVRELLLAEKNLQRKSDSYWKEENPTRRRQTTLLSRRETASEWFGKCEIEFEKYINEHIVDGVFSLNNTDDFIKIIKGNNYE